MANETEKQAIEYTQTGASLESKLAVRERVDIDPDNPKKGKKQVWLSNEPYTTFPLHAFLPGLELPYAIKQEPLGDKKEAVSVIAYATAAAQFVYDAVNARVEASAKQQLKSGNTPATTIEELLTSSRGGQYMAQVSAFKKDASKFLASKGNSEAKVAGIIKLMDPRVLSEAADNRKAMVNKVIEAMAADSNYDLEPYETFVNNLLAALEQQDEDDEEISL
jgi:hypothetical protein